MSGAATPYFSLRAHVFEIDQTKKGWKPCSSQAVPVSMYHDATHDLHRVVSVDGTKALINSAISSSAMAFTKTSQKFGQWRDPRAKTVYGLGFASEADLDAFAAKFKEALSEYEKRKERRRRDKEQGQEQEAAASADGPRSDGSSTSASSASHNTSSSSPSTSTSSTVTTPNISTASVAPSSAASRGPATASAHAATPAPAAEPPNELVYENERLKKALAASSANAKQWEAELQTLKNNNARLTSALQESAGNVDEWKKQLAAWKEESQKWKRRAQELETTQSTELQKAEAKIAQLQGRIASLETAREEAQVCSPQFSKIKKGGGLLASR